MSDDRVSQTAKEIITKALSQWADQPEANSDGQPEGLVEVVDTLIHDLDSAGFAIEPKISGGEEVRAIDIGYQALKMKRAEAAVREWLTEQSKNGVVKARAFQAPGWSDYQREQDNFNSAVARASQNA
jgi:hypothetical protein